MSLKTKICKEIDAKVDKDFISNALLEGQAEPGGPEQQVFNGELQGTILPDGGTFNGVNIFGLNQWDEIAHPPENFSIGPIINPACGGPDGSADIGTLVINPNLPADLTATSFDLTIEILDNSAGLGGMFLFCESTLEVFEATQSAYNSTTTWDISNAPCDPDDIRVGISAFGATSSYPVTSCDEINPVPETIVVVTPSACLAAAACAESLFGCSIGDMLLANPENPITTLEEKIEDFKVPVYRLSISENGYNVKAWFDDDGKAVAHPAGLNTVEEVDVFIDSVFDTSSGQPVHVNGDPSLETVFGNSSNFNDNLAFPDGQGGGLDQYVITTYIDTTGIGPMDLGDFNGNSGEAGRIYLSNCCGPLRTAGHILDARPYYAGQFATALPEGIHCVMVLLSDRTAFGGFQLRWKPTGTEEFSNVPISNLWTKKREVECMLMSACDVAEGSIPEGWQAEEPKLCSPAPSII